jgi:hypothetical protein
MQPKAERELSELEARATLERSSQEILSCQTKYRTLWKYEDTNGTAVEDNYSNHITLSV